MCRFRDVILDFLSVLSSRVFIRTFYAIAWYMYVGTGDRYLQISQNEVMSRKNSPRSRSWSSANVDRGGQSILILSIERWNVDTGIRGWELTMQRLDHGGRSETWIRRSLKRGVRRILVVGGQWSLRRFVYACQGFKTGLNRNVKLRRNCRRDGLENGKFEKSEETYKINK